MRTLTKYIRHAFKHEIAFIYNRNYSIIKPKWNIMFFGTDDFSVNSLKSLNNELKRNRTIKCLEVVTSTKTKLNSVKKYSQKEKLVVHDWPVTIAGNKYDLGVVVSFGYLIPDTIIKKFPLGIINVHASLLPRWRGAAPIIHSIANGDVKTGVTIMKIQPKKFDIGEILAQEEVDINENTKMPELYAQLADVGARLLVSCLENLTERFKNARPQPLDGISYAPKVTQKMSVVDWHGMPSKKIYNLARALDSLFPLTTKWNNVPVKLFDVSNDNLNFKEETCLPGTVRYHKQTKKLIVKCSDGTWISCGKIGLPGKKPMSANDFNNGYIKKELLENRLFK